ncbi:MAG TPA: hypothetical protein VFQ44_23560 [Streptosporangiaceae bacterium]|nr:hypothetical protein [Streptosporangiaceae bacterium]
MATFAIDAGAVLTGYEGIIAGDGYGLQAIRVKRLLGGSSVRRAGDIRLTTAALCNDTAYWVQI